MNNNKIDTQLVKLLYGWRDALMGKNGFIKALGAVCVLALFALALFVLVRIIAAMLPVVTSIVIIIILIALSSLALAPTVIKYLASLSFLQKNREKFIQLSSNTLTLTNSDSDVNQLTLSASSATIIIRFSSLPQLSVDLHIDQCPSHALSYLWEKVGNELIFKQGPASKRAASPVYTITVSIPLEKENLSINARLIEGSLALGGGTMDTLRVEAVNSSILLNDLTMQHCKLYGLNLSVGSDNIKLNNLTVRSTGDNFRFSFKDDNRGAKLKTNTALSVFTVDGVNIGKSFSHGLLELWPAVSSDDGYMNLEFDTISATINISKPKASS